MEYRNELLDKLVGGRVLVKQLTAPELDEELAKNIAESPLSMASQLLQSRTAMLVLTGYDGLGVTLELVEDDPVAVFVPWSAIIELSAIEDET